MLKRHLNLNVIGDMLDVALLGCCPEPLGSLFLVLHKHDRQEKLLARRILDGMYPVRMGRLLVECGLPRSRYLAAPDL